MLGKITCFAYSYVLVCINIYSTYFTSLHVHTCCVQPRGGFKDKDGRVRYYKGLDEEIPEQKPEGKGIL